MAIAKSVVMCASHQTKIYWPVHPMIVRSTYGTQDRILKQKLLKDTLRLFFLLIFQPTAE